ncbi:hypothetical protein [Sphingomonas jaspsi]|uniref:hypothetical protein n=1 Tax=Sphingomonas jaspsi TaxID=392409 RepID=UPI0004B0727F|nr:hypothetical protein [Sphingomonas jaspsi]
MRAIFVLLIVAVIGLIAAIQFGLINITQTQPATTPTVTAENGVIRAEPGQAPAFDVETGTVGVGTREANVVVPQVEVTKGQATVKVPTVEVNKPADAPAKP